MNGLRVVDTGGGASGRTVCFSHGLLFSHAMFEPQIAALRGEHRVVAWDHRGQGQSEVPPGRIVTIEQCTADAIGLIEALGVAPVDFVGLSMGGFVGMRIAARRPELVRSLALLATAPDPEPPAHLPRYRALTLVARTLGVNRWLAARVLKIMCAPATLADPARAAVVDRVRQLLMANGRSVYKAVNGVLERAGCEGELAAIRCPTTVIRGTGDQAIARERARLLVDGIAGARWVEVPDAGHTASLEAPEALTAALREHLAAS